MNLHLSRIGNFALDKITAGLNKITAGLDWATARITAANEAREHRQRPHDTYRFGQDGRLVEKRYWTPENLTLLAITPEDLLDRHAMPTRFAVHDHRNLAPQQFDIPSGSHIVEIKDDMVKIRLGGRTPFALYGFDTVLPTGSIVTAFLCGMKSWAIWHNDGRDHVSETPRYSMLYSVQLAASMQFVFEDGRDITLPAGAVITDRFGREIKAILYPEETLGDRDRLLEVDEPPKEIAVVRIPYDRLVG